VNRALELRPSAPSLLDTLGYTYLKAERYEEARADFEEIFDQGLEFVCALLGDGGGLGDPGRGYETSGRIARPLPGLSDSHASL